MDWNNIVSEDGFVNLFNGVDLQGWSMAGRGKFRIIEQERALESEDGMGLLWYTYRMYGDFILKIDPLPVRGYQKAAAIVLLSVLIYQIMVYYNCITGNKRPKVIKHMLGS